MEAVEETEETYLGRGRKNGVSEDIDQRATVSRNRYHRMVTKTCIARAISKKSLS